MAKFTENLNLELPEKTEQYNIAVQNSNMQKIDDFSKLTPPRALTADKLTAGVTINDVFFDGTENIKITTGGGGLTMFAHIWSDHIYNDVSYLRADTFSWHYASIYKTGYEHLLEQYNHEKSVQKTENGVIYRLTPDNFKIADASQQDAIRELYENTGSAWYYILDTENECFKLPREKAELGIHCPSKAPVTVSDLDIYGNGMTLGLTNGSQNFGIAGYTGSNQAYMSPDSYGQNVGDAVSANSLSNNWLGTGIISDPEKSGITGEGTGTADLSGITTERTNTDTKKYLYFYVGNYEREETEVAIGEISESLNNKVDLDGKNFIGSGLDEVIHEHFAGGFEIGDIGFTQGYIDELKGKRRAINKADNYIIQDQFEEFTKWLKKSAELNPEMVCTNEEYETILTMSSIGMCDKYVIDDEAGTIRLPKYPDYFIGGVNDIAPVVGNGLTLGLTNGTNNVGIQTRGTQNVIMGVIGTSAEAYGGAYGQITDTTVPTMYKTLGVTTDPTKSGIEAQINQEQIKGTYFIQVATYSEIEDKIINEIELNNPFSLLDYKYSEYELNNISWLRSNGQFNSNAIYPAVYELLVKLYNGTETKAGVIVKLNTEEFTDYDFVINPQDNTFRCPLKLETNIKNGFDYTKGYAVTSSFTATEDGLVAYTLGTNATGSAKINGVTVLQKQIVGVDDNASLTQTFQCSKGDVIVLPQSGIFYPQKEVANTEYLYFYVGETVQNANLINIGRIEEIVVNKLDRSNKQEIVSWGIPDYSREIIPSHPTSSAPFTAPADGIFVDCFYYSTGNISHLYVNGVETEIVMKTGDSNRDNRASVTVPLSKGDVIYWGTGSTNTFGIGFYPFKGSN